MVNLSGGTITNLTVNPGSIVNVSGSGTITNAPSGSGNVNYNNVTIPGTLTITPDHQPEQYRGTNGLGSVCNGHAE